MGTTKVVLELTDEQVKDLLEQIGEDATGRRGPNCETAAYKTREAIKQMISEEPVGFVVNMRNIEIYFALNNIEAKPITISNAIS